MPPTSCMIKLLGVGAITDTDTICEQLIARQNSMANICFEGVLAINYNGRGRSIYSLPS